MRRGRSFPRREDVGIKCKVRCEGGLRGGRVFVGNNFFPE